MFKITPPIWKNVQYGRLLALLVVTCTLILSACTCRNNKVSTEDAPRPVNISLSLYHNPDSLAYYARKAYKEEDPKGFYVTGVASYLALFDEWPDSLTTVDYNVDGWLMIWRAAQLGYPDALQLIHCLDANGLWFHSIPEPIEE